MRHTHWPLSVRRQLACGSTFFRRHEGADRLGSDALKTFEFEPTDCSGDSMVRGFSISKLIVPRITQLSDAVEKIGTEILPMLAYYTRV